MTETKRKNCKHDFQPANNWFADMVRRNGGGDYQKCTKCGQETFIHSDELV